MAIQFRRGSYSDFNPSKLVEGEIAVVLSGDPTSSTGRSLYICFAPGVVKRIADYEDIEDLIDDATEDVQASFTSGVNQAIAEAGTATTAANTAASSANTAASGATSAASSANSAASAANSAAEAANAAAAGDISSKTVTFTAAAEQLDLSTGDTTASLFGKISKWLSDLKAAAFRDVANNLTTTSAGAVLDARQGAALKEEIDEIVDLGDQGTEISASSSLNSFTTYGRYYSPNSTRTGTLSNIPSGLTVGFTMDVDRAASQIRQTIYSGRSAGPDMWVRNGTGSSWSSWYKVTMTSV